MGKPVDYDADVNDLKKNTAGELYKEYMKTIPISQDKKAIAELLRRVAVLERQIKE